MDVLDHLMDEHRKVEGLLTRLKSSEPGQDREAMFRELSESLEVHMKVEERFIYPLMAEHLDAETADEAEDEHALTRDGLAGARDRLEEGAFEAAIEVLQAGIGHHVQEEESELFPELRQKAAAELAELDPNDLEAQVEVGGAGPTRDELYEKAKAEGVEGRSTMTKGELAEAVES
ncbi:MAG: hypothetical protein JWM89_1256 [Acidimicrobiales bacterium]|nr:hypothetical protein [Acidimicrobiales bacterium]